MPTILNYSPYIWAMNITTEDKAGRRRMPAHLKKKPHGLSFTDAEWKELDRQATKAGHTGPSAYIVSKLNLS